MPSGLLGNQIESKRKKEPTWEELLFMSCADLTSAGEKTYVFLTLLLGDTAPVGWLFFNQAHLEAGLDVFKCALHSPIRPIWLEHALTGKAFWLQVFWGVSRDHSSHCLHSRGAIKFPLDDCDPCPYSSLPATPNRFPLFSPLKFPPIFWTRLALAGSLQAHSTKPERQLSGCHLFLASPCAPGVLAHLLVWLSQHPESHSSYCCPGYFTLQQCSAFLDMGLLTECPGCFLKNSHLLTLGCDLPYYKVGGLEDPWELVTFHMTPLLSPLLAVMLWSCTSHRKCPFTLFLRPSFHSYSHWQAPVLFLGLHFCYDNVPVNMGLPSLPPCFALGRPF